MKIPHSSQPKTLTVYTPPVADTTTYEIARDKIYSASTKDPSETVSGGMSLAFLRAITKRSLPEKEYLNNTNANYYLTPWSQLEGKGTSVHPVGAFSGITGNFKNNEETRIELQHEAIESALQTLEARLPQVRLQRFKELLRTSFEDEKADRLQKLQAEDPIIYKLYTLESVANIDSKAKEEFENTFRTETSKIFSEADPELVKLLNQRSQRKLMENPYELWMAIVKNLYEQELLQAPHKWEVSEANLDNISWITRRNFETLASVQNRPLSSSTSNHEPKTDIGSLLQEIQKMDQDQKQNLILSPFEIVSIVQPFYRSYKEDGIIKQGKSIEYYSERNKFHLSQAERFEGKVKELKSTLPISEEAQQKILESEKKKNKHIAEAKRYEELFLRNIEENSTWLGNGTRIVPGIEGIKFVRAKDYSKQADQEVTDPNELNGRILRREIQALSYFREQQDKKLVSFLTKAMDYLSKEGLSPSEIRDFLNIYTRSLSYYGKGLKGKNSSGKEEILGGYGQISFAVAQITNLSQGSPSAKELHRCLELVAQKTLNTEEAQTELVKLSPEQLKNLRNEFLDRVGVDLLAFEPETAVFGEDGREYRPKQPHDKKDPVNIIKTQDGTSNKPQDRNQTIIRDVRGSFIESTERLPEKTTEKEELEEHSGNNPMHNFYGKITTPIKDFYNWAVNNPKLSPAMKREKLAESAIDKVFETTLQGFPSEEIIPVLFKWLIKPTYLSFSEKEFLAGFALPRIYEIMGIQDIRRLSQEQIIFENNVFRGLKNIDKGDPKALNTQALVNAILKKFGGNIQFATDSELTPEHDLKIISNRCKLIREAWTNKESKASAFFTENSDRINYYAGYSDLLYSTEGRLKFILDLESQWADWIKAYGINDHNERVNALENSKTGQKFIEQAVESCSTEGYQIISEWLNQNLKSCAYKSYLQIIQELPENVQRALNDNKQFGDFLRAQEKYIEALLHTFSPEETVSFPSYYTDSLKALFYRTTNNTFDFITPTPSSEARLQSFNMAEENAMYLVNECEQIINDTLHNPPLDRTTELAKRADILQWVIGSWNNYPEYRSIMHELDQWRRDPKNWERADKNYLSEQEYVADIVLEKLASIQIRRTKQEIMKNQELLKKFIAIMQNPKTTITEELENTSIANTIMNNDSFISLISIIKAGFELSLPAITSLKSKTFEEGLITQADGISLKGNYKQGIDTCNNVIDRLTEQGAEDNRLKDALFMRGLIQHRNDNKREALKDYKACLDINSNDARIWAEIGITRKSMNNLEGAIEALNRALELEPNNFAALNLLAEIRIEQDRIREAISLYARATQAYPNYYAGYISQAELKLLILDVAGAKKSLKVLYDINPEYLTNRKKELKSLLEDTQAKKTPTLQEHKINEETIKSYKKRIDFLTKFLESTQSKGFSS